jgi:hypothetical protein
MSNMVHKPLAPTIIYKIDSKWSLTVKHQNEKATSLLACITGIIHTKLVRLTS